MIFRLPPQSSQSRSQNVRLRSGKKQRLAASRNAASSGSVLIWALIFVLVLIGTAVAMSRRGFFSLVGSTFVRDSKLAREAAEIGLIRTVALLNEPRNRRLLVNATKLNSSTGDALEADQTLVSPCQLSGPDMTMSLGALKDATTNTYPIIAIDNQRTYQIQSISQPSASDESSGASFNLGLGTSSTNATAGEIVITVKGTAKRGSQTVGEFTVTRTLEVLPKCCGLSLGGKSTAFGGDIRQCGADDSGLGLIAGVYYKNNGDFDITGSNGIQFFSDAAKTKPLSAVYCIDTSATNDCLDGDATLKSGTGTKLKEVGADIPDVPASTIDPKSCKDNSYVGLANIGPGTPVPECVIHIDDDYTLSTSDFSNWGEKSTIVLYSTSTATFQTTVPSLVYNTETITARSVICSGKDVPVNGCNSAGQTVTRPGNNQSYTYTTTVLSGTTSVTSATTSLTSFSTGTTVNTVTNEKLKKLREHCRQQTESGTTVTYCSIDQLFIANNKSLIFDTTGGPIRIYFRDKSTVVTPSILLQNGQSGLGQIKNGNSSPPYADMALLGMSLAESALPAAACPSTGPCQHVQLGGGNSGSTNFFAYFPSGLVELQGSTTMNGMVWTNTITATGSVDFVSTSTGVGSVLSYLGIKNQNTPGSEEPILKEYVTRLTKRFRFF